MSLERIEENRIYYEHCLPVLKKLYEQGLYEDCLLYAQKLALHCWHNFSGLYYSFEIEDLLSKIGRQLLPSIATKLKNKTDKPQKHILHICSEIHESGGHSKLLFNWIGNDKDNRHALLSTRMERKHLENVSKSYTESQIEDLYTLDSKTLIGKAYELLQHIIDGYDLIILHTHPNEVLINVVLSDPKFKIPVLFLNHADHIFWLGASVCDVAVQIRETNIDLDSIRRQLPSSYYLPIPIDFPKEENEIVIRDDKTIKLLSIGTEYKYDPDNNYNFYAEMLRLVKTHPNVEINLIGISPISGIAQQHQHPRLHYLGILPHHELNKYRKECTLYVEGFPMPSFTALLETTVYKKPFILHYEPKSVFRLFKDDVEHGIVYPDGKKNWRSMIDKLISDKDYRNKYSQKQFEFISNEYAMEMWLSRLEKLYEIANKKNAKNEKSSKDVFYSSENEKLVAQTNFTEIDHLSHIENLCLLYKLKVFRSRPKSFSFLKKITKKQLVKFYLPTFFYTTKKLLQRILLF